MKHSTDESKVKVVNNQGLAGWVLCMAYIGAAVYFVHMSHGFWGFIWALLKAAAWPAYVLYYGLTELGVR